MGDSAVFVQEGTRVAIVDNFIRRHWDIELGVQTLTPIRPLRQRSSCGRN